MLHAEDASPARRQEQGPIVRCDDERGEHYLAKPYTPLELAEKIREAIGGSTTAWWRTPRRTA